MWSLREKHAQCCLLFAHVWQAIFNILRRLCWVPESASNRNTWASDGIGDRLFRFCLKSLVCRSYVRRTGASLLQARFQSTAYKGTARRCIIITRRVDKADRWRQIQTNVPDTSMRTSVAMKMMASWQESAATLRAASTYGSTERITCWRWALKSCLVTHTHNLTCLGPACSQSYCARTNTALKWTKI